MTLAYLSAALPFTADATLTISALIAELFAPLVRVMCLWYRLLGDGLVKQHVKSRFHLPLRCMVACARRRDWPLKLTAAGPAPAVI
jgi:hypothetical protein